MASSSTPTSLRVDLSGCRAERVGPDHGIADRDWDALAAASQAAHGDLTRAREAGELPAFDLPHQDTSPVLEVAERIRGRFENFLLVGIGGSTLGPKAAHQALAHPQYNLLSREERGGPRFFLLENIDPRTIQAQLAMLDPATTCINVVSKSGATAETAANFMVAMNWLSRGVTDSAAHVVATTDPQSGDLRTLANREGWATLPIPSGVGGRFSQLTAVGLLPAAVCGLSITELLAGAADMERRTRDGDVQKNPAYQIAAAHFIANRHKGKPISVMMPYTDGLGAFADWYVQLWAESLGKAKDLDGKPVHVGQTPLAAVGAIDQHSQVQLFVEGPNDKITTFIRIEEFADPVAIPPMFADVAGMAYLGGKDLGTLLNFEQSATEQVLAEHGRPSLRIDLPRLNAHSLGELLFLYEMATAFAGGLYRIDPFDQPGVEHGKRLTYRAMGRPGFTG